MRRLIRWALAGNRAAPTSEQSTPFASLLCLPSWLGQVLRAVDCRLAVDLSHQFVVAVGRCPPMRCDKRHRRGPCSRRNQRRRAQSRAARVSPDSGRASWAAMVPVAAARQARRQSGRAVRLARRCRHSRDQRGPRACLRAARPPQPIRFACLERAR